MASSEGVLRVWAANIEAPGLAMTRSMADTFGRQAGIISTPEVKYFKLTNEIRYFILGSDGIWDMLTEEDVACIVQTSLGTSNLAEKAKILVDAAHQKWVAHCLEIDKDRKTMHTIDDITAVIVKLPEDKSNDF